MEDLKLQLIQCGTPMIYACEGVTKSKKFLFLLTYQNGMR